MMLLLLQILQYLTFTFVLLSSKTTTIRTTKAASTQQQKKSTYETHISRRERHLDHWDAETLAAYLGLDVDTAKPLNSNTNTNRDSNTYDNTNTYTGIDASIMFYAQWCTNCHKFAPVWDAIGNALKAGTTQSNVILALFNCELNDVHTRLCDAAGVTHYPTIMFVGAGPYMDSDPVSSFVFNVGNKKSKDGKNKISKASGPYGPTKLARTVKFQGDLNTADSVLDWIKTMQGLSRWYKWGHFDGGWLKVVRSLFFTPFDRLKRSKSGNTSSAAATTGGVGAKALPIGVPPNMNAGGTIGGASSATTGGPSVGGKPTYVIEKELKEAQSKIDKIETELEDHKAATKHAGFLIESFLFPKMAKTTTKADDSEGNGNTTNTSENESTEPLPLDVFTVLHKTDGWNSKISTNTESDSKLSIAENQWYIIKACVVDLALDYCTRFSKKATNDYLETISLENESENNTNKYPSFTEMETQLRQWINDREPYCGSFDECVSGNFDDEEKCRPEACPFTNDGACRYVNGCLSDSIMGEYRDYLEEKVIASASASASASATSAKDEDNEASGGAGSGKTDAKKK
eukprot:CAMPEP_0203684938 /NCGR_PEP_ID=MMETSP0090-20130426/48290_1 /ASSEMBLY_ACC=CAM_ASM_001088 /TAXON_ID=426623 /ORGANISM="Chaetoceros affinis, Strain CCMP159" /LENGTH=575 /DNA_ID=CAMNT_0050554121 /DNA_START=66 /DNA_END=1793 /DNA_ORIENTATION=-